MYKYLGVVFDSKLNWKENINSVLKKGNSRMYCTRKLRSFGERSKKEKKKEKKKKTV